MLINSIYLTFQGEQNPFGIGAPVVFVRTQGCHIRCYMKTLGVLCDTPEALEREGGKEMDTIEILDEVERVGKGVKLICLSGGDPLWRKSEQVRTFFKLAYKFGYKVCVETSGTLDWTTYEDFPDVYWVLDYKLKSAGVRGNLVDSFYSLLGKRDFIKFVIYDEVDYKEFKAAMALMRDCKAKIAVGVYWNGPMKTFDLFNKLVEDNLVSKVVLNFQAHKVLYPDYDNKKPTQI